MDKLKSMEKERKNPQEKRKKELEGNYFNWGLKRRGGKIEGVLRNWWMGFPLFVGQKKRKKEFFPFYTSLAI